MRFIPSKEFVKEGVRTVRVTARIIILQVVENQAIREDLDIQRGDAIDYYLTENMLHLRHLAHLTLSWTRLFS